MPTVSPPPHSGFGAGGTTRAAARLWVRGVVQGVGFRPFVYGLARRHGLAGWVRNTSAGVQIHVEGPAAEVQAFAAALPEEAPPRSHIVSIDKADAEPVGEAAFRILESAVDPSAYHSSPGYRLLSGLSRRAPGPGRTGDSAIRSPNCKTAGPRFTSSSRCRTTANANTMRHFTMSRNVRRSTKTEDRRFPLSPMLSVCGPRLAAGGRGDGRSKIATEPECAHQACAKLLRADSVRLKGRGGLPHRLRRHRPSRRRAAQAPQAASAQAPRRDVRRRGTAAAPLPLQRGGRGAARFAGTPHRAARMASPRRSWRAARGSRHRPGPRVHGRS